MPQGGGNAATPSGKHDISSRLVPAAEQVDVVSTREKTYVIWEPTLPLSRPRARIQRPAIYFTGNLTIASRLSRTSERHQQVEYLASYQPLSANVLEPLQYDPSFADTNVFMSESRITKVAPRAANPQDNVRPIRGASKRAFPAVPALFTKIKYSCLPDAIIASLHLETSQIIVGGLDIARVELSASDAQVEPLTKLEFPQRTHGGDETILLYRLTSAKGTQPSALPVSIAVSAHALVDQMTRIKLELSWQSQVDASQSVLQPVYKWSRPLSTASGHHRGASTQSLSGSAPPETVQALGGGNPGIIFSFTGPASVHNGSEFKLDVKCNNQSGRQRRFALVMLQPRKPRAAELSIDKSADTDLIAKMFNAPLLERPHRPDVLDLNPDKRVGPLPTGACFETDLRFRALTVGALSLGILRIVDLDTRQTVDVRDLPDVVSLDTSER